MEQQESLRITPKWITSLQKDEVFVFGSNINGMHGGGAARVAMDKFGAVWEKACKGSRMLSQQWRAWPISLL